MPKLNKFSDEELAEIVRTKDNSAYAELIHRYEKKLLRYATYLINDEDLAADAVQEGFIKAYINLNSFNSKLKFSSWLYRIVHNQAINLISKNKRNISTDEILEMGSGTNLEDEFIKKEIKNNLHDCLNKINLLYKVPLTLYFLEEKSYEEISNILRIPIGTVGTRINRAKIMVKKICQKKQ